MSIGYLIESLAVSQIRVMAAGAILLVVPIATSSRRRNFSKPVSDHALVSYGLVDLGNVLIVTSGYALGYYQNMPSSTKPLRNSG